MSIVVNSVGSPTVSTEELAPLHALLDPAYPENLRTIAEWLFLQLVEDADLLGQAYPDISPALRLLNLATVALRQAERLSTEEGGNALYLNKGISYRATVRDREMYARFTGNNIEALAKAYRISPMRVRQIINAMILLERASRQGKLDLV
jgi:Mor family transcriptional regulator